MFGVRMGSVAEIEGLIKNLYKFIGPWTFITTLHSRNIILHFLLQKDPGLLPSEEVQPEGLGTKEQQVQIVGCLFETEGISGSLHDEKWYLYSFSLLWAPRSLTDWPDFLGTQSHSCTWNNHQLFRVTFRKVKGFSRITRNSEKNLLTWKNKMKSDILHLDFLFLAWFFRYWEWSLKTSRRKFMDP